MADINIGKGVMLFKIFREENALHTEEKHPTNNRFGAEYIEQESWKIPQTAK